MSAAVKREPAVRIVKRDSIPRWKSWGIRLLSVVLALILSGLFIFAVTKLNPIQVYVEMYSGALGTTNRTWTTIRDTMMLLCIGVGLAPAFKMRFWNIGAEGQILVGGCCTAGMMIYLGAQISTPLLLCLMAVVSIIAGALWGLVPAIFKSRWNTNETLFTLMMNYIATQLCAFFIIVWEVPKGAGKIGIINQSTQIGWLPEIGNQYLLSIVVVAVLTVAMYVYLSRSKHGYEIAVVGESLNTARYAGIKPSRVIIRTMVLSGAICGLIGLLLVGGINHTLTTTVVGGQGFTAVMVSWLAKFNPLVMVLASALLVFLSRGANEIASDFGLNQSFSDILTGIILFFIIGSEFFINYQIHFRKAGEKEA